MPSWESGRNTTQAGGCGRRKVREQGTSATCRLQVIRLGPHREPEARGVPSRGSEADVSGVRRGLRIPAVGLPGTCRFGGHPEFPACSLVCVRNAPGQLRVFWPSGRKSASLWTLARDPDGAGRQPGYFDRFGPREGCPKSATGPEPKTCWSSFACSRSSAAPAEAEKAGPRETLSGSGFALRSAS